MPDPVTAEPTEPELPAWAVVLGVGMLTAAGLLSAVLELLWIPLYAGTVVVPASIGGAVVGNVVLPWLARGLGVPTRAASLPFAGWLLVVLIAVLLPRPEGDVVVPGGSLTWVTYGVLLGGVVAGMITLVVLSSPSLVDQPPAAPRRPVSPPPARPARRPTPGKRPAR